MEDNKMIAEFMNEGYWQVWKIGGYKPYWADKLTSKDAAQKLIEDCDKDRFERFGENVDMIKNEVEPKFIAPDYHKSWDWLMPVVEKIESLGKNTLISNISGHYCNIMTGVSLMESSINNPSKFLGQGESKIEAVYKALVEFINWYNQNK